MARSFILKYWIRILDIQMVFVTVLPFQIQNYDFTIALDWLIMSCQKNMSMLFAYRMGVMGGLTMVCKIQLCVVTTTTTTTTSKAQQIKEPIDKCLGLVMLLQKASQMWQCKQDTGISSNYSCLLSVGMVGICHLKMQ